MVKKKTKKQKSEVGKPLNTSKYPRHNLERVLRLPQAMLDQNAGKDCSEQELAKFVGVGFNGPFKLEVSSALKYGLLERPSAGKVRVTDLSKSILRPQIPSDKKSGLRKAFLNAPDISDVYNHYRNENLPDPEFFENALVDRFKVPRDKISEFKSILMSGLKTAELVEDHGGKIRILDFGEQLKNVDDKTITLKKLEKEVQINTGDSCFVMMPFAKPIGDYYEKIYAPAIKKAGLIPMRADDDIFKTGKIINQIWTGITSCKVLVAELTGRNPNVFYELGLAHAKDKPVVLVCSNEDDVPFDLKHIRVIYYDIHDPFWGQKLMDKIAENILSALNDPSEAVFQSALK